MITFLPSAQRAGRETHQLWVFGDSEELGVTQVSSDAGFKDVREGGGSLDKK